MTSNFRAAAATTVLGFGALACAPPPAAPVAAEAPVYPPMSAADSYFPLVAGKLYHYVTDDSGEQGMLVATVTRTDATHGALRIGNADKRFVYDAKGVSYEGGTYVLKVPLVLGTTWSGEHGGETRITATDAPITVPAGTYAGCIETREDVVPTTTYLNTYCPGVGLVRIGVTTPTGHATVELKRYGAPVVVK